MVRKVLFWLGSEFTHFCLSHYLQKIIDDEFYAIIDITNKPKSFFQSQILGSGFKRGLAISGFGFFLYDRDPNENVVKRRFRERNRKGK